MGLSLVLDVSACRDGSPAQSLDGRLAQDTPFGELKGAEVSCASQRQSYTSDSNRRLSRPSLAAQYALPNSQDLGISPKASLAYPSDTNTNDKFILSPALNLPEAFGSAYVGETFSCTLCANNELLPSDHTKAISGVRIQGDMQTPSNPSGSPLDLAGADGEVDGAVSPSPGESLQRILRFELKEEGNHVLAVTVTYTETALGEGKASGGRVRTFRKLYQFVAQQLLSVRTKAGDLSQKNGMSRYLLEAQLENMGEAAVSLEVRQPTIAPLCLQTSAVRVATRFSASTYVLQR
jgi:hypothetical protein